MVCNRDDMCAASDANNEPSTAPNSDLSGSSYRGDDIQSVETSFVAKDAVEPEKIMSEGESSDAEDVEMDEDSEYDDTIDDNQASEDEQEEGGAVSESNRKRKRGESTGNGEESRSGRRHMCHVATCRRVYKKKDKLQHHIRCYHQVVEGETFPCKHCAEGFNTRHECDLHVSQSHKDDISAAIASFACQVIGCGRSYSKREHLTRHFRAVHEKTGEDKPFQCTLCGVRFVYKHGLTRHHKNCHSDTAERPYQCSVCLLAFKKKTQLQAHAFVHTGVLPFECGDCGERFAKRFQLVRHERTHNGSTALSQTQVFLCDEPDCDELLLSVDEKRQHMRDAHGYTEEQPKKATAKRERSVFARELRCQVCDREFERVQNLRSHLRTHFEAVDDRKRHVCPVEGCERAYTRQSNLMAHYNATHDPTKSKRFKCPIAGCDGAFGYKKVLVSHIASVHEKKEADEVAATPSRKRGREAMSVFASVLGADKSTAQEETHEMSD